MTISHSLASAQVSRIAMMCDFLSNPALSRAAVGGSPVTMPQTIGSMGFDEPTWVGLGIVGLWAALDAYAERSSIKSTCPACDRGACLFGRLTSDRKIGVHLHDPLAEIEDLRHLFAHNFAGLADTEYFSTKRKRHVLVASHSVTLSSGAVFDGSRIQLMSKDLRHYASNAAVILTFFL